MVTWKGEWEYTYFKTVLTSKQHPQTHFDWHNFILIQYKDNIFSLYKSNRHFAFWISISFSWQRPTQETAHKSYIYRIIVIWIVSTLWKTISDKGIPVLLEVIKAGFNETKYLDGSFFIFFWEQLLSVPVKYYDNN